LEQVTRTKLTQQIEKFLGRSQEFYRMRRTIYRLLKRMKMLNLIQRRKACLVIKTKKVIKREVEAKPLTMAA
jgi:hypothetical protein